MKIPFVDYSGLAHPKKCLQEWIQYHTVGIIAAPQGAGLTRLLEHTVVNTTLKIAYIQLFEPHKAQVRTVKIASSATVIGFSLLWSQLNRLSRPHSDAQKIPNYPSSIAPVTDRDFLKAYDGILSLLENPRSSVEAIIIDNAHLGDSKLFTILLQLIDECHIPPALILGVRLEGFAKADEALSRQRAVIPQLEQRRKPILSLEKITLEVFDEEILPRFLWHSNMYLDPAVDAQQDAVAAALWDRTNGNWHRMHLLYTALQIHAVATEEQTLVLTWAAYKKILQELDGFKA